MIHISHYKDAAFDNAKEGDFIYLDPPYYPESPTPNLTRFASNGFSSKDHEELTHLFRKVNDRNL
ncbi:MAG: DNA adenine methylase [Nitrososphaeraceae archaeon]